MTTPIPKWFELAKKEIGTKETPGKASNPHVGEYYLDAAGSKQTDDVPWCAAFVGSMLKRAGETPSGSLMARSYLAWGEKDNSPSPGTIVVFARGAPPSGHVAFYVRDIGGGRIEVLGGNQKDAVNIKARKKSQVLGYRWPAAKKKAMKFAEAKTMTAQEIMAGANKLYSDIDSTYSIGGTRAAAKTAASLLYYLAKLQAAATLKARKR